MKLDLEDPTGTKSRIGLGYTAGMQVLLALLKRLQRHEILPLLVQVLALDQPPIQWCRRVAHTLLTSIYQSQPGWRAAPSPERRYPNDPPLPSVSLTASSEQSCEKYTRIPH